MIAYRPATGRLAQDSGAIPFAKGAVYPLLPVLAAVALVMFLAVAWTQPEHGPVARYLPVPDEDAVPGELIVRFWDDVPGEQRAAVLASAGATLKRDLLLEGFVTATVALGHEDEAGTRLAALGAIAAVERDLIRQPAFGPNDPAYPAQWNFPMIQMEEAWDASRFEGSDGTKRCCGDGVVVAVLDTGVAFEDYWEPRECGVDICQPAPDLAASTFWCFDKENPCPAWNAYRDWQAQCKPEDKGCLLTRHDSHARGDGVYNKGGHGTFVAGLIAGATNNGQGAAGIAYNARILPVKVCGPKPYPDHEYGCPSAAIANGIVWAVQSGARVINLSLGSGGTGTDLEEEALNMAESHGMVVVAAAGNHYPGDDPSLLYPAEKASVVAVGAVGMNEARAPYSNTGGGSQKDRPELVAPGGGGTSDADFIFQETYRDFCDESVEGVFPREFGRCPGWGTSFAAPHVSGVVALVLAKFPHLEPQDIRDLLQCSAKDLGPPGPDSEYGAGLLQAYEALRDGDHDGTPNCVDPVFDTPTPAPTPVPNACEDPVALPSGAPAWLMCGDVDGDGDVDPVDALIVMRYTAAIPSSAAYMGLGYVDCDGDLDTVDALFILRHAAGLPLSLDPPCHKVGYGPDRLPPPPPKIPETR